MDASHAEHENPPKLSPATQLVGLGRPAHEPGAPLNPAVQFTSTFVAGGDIGYARVGNQTWTAFEDTLGSLEGGRALAFASGMGAISACLDLTAYGSVVVAPTTAYNGTCSVLEEWNETGRVAARRVPMDDTDALLEAMDGAAMLWIESPTNPMLEVADIPRLTAYAKQHGVLTVCDNTFLTPLLQRPLQLGVDVVVHSATKYLAGHSDVVMGATVTADDALYDRLLAKRTLGGAIPGPMETWLALRGMRTMHLRIERASANAAELARRLRELPTIERVRHPGIGAIVSVELTGGRSAAEALEQSVQVWTPATSLGGVESTLERRRRHASEPALVPEALVRLSVGVEDVEDLWRDLKQALDRLA